MNKMIKLSLVVVMTSTTLLTADTSSDISNLANTLLNKIEMPDDAADWLKRTSIQLRIEENYKPTWKLETVQPIYQKSVDDIYFWQFNAATRNNIETYNLGVGYRNIIKPNLMLGINSFYDYQQDYKHKRWSIGLEALCTRFEFRANRYLAISGKKEIATNIFEQALDGWDAEVGGRLIPNSNLKTYAKYTIWDGIQTNDLKQKSIRLEYPINNSINLEVAYTNDNEQQTGLDKSRLMAQLIVAFGKKSTSSKNMDTSVDLHDKLLVPVKRENEIIVEKTVTGAGVTIGRRY